MKSDRQENRIKSNPGNEFFTLKKFVRLLERKSLPVRPQKNEKRVAGAIILFRRRAISTRLPARNPI